jgi:hypothetical protein
MSEKLALPVFRVVEKNMLLGEGVALYRERGE